MTSFLTAPERSALESYVAQDKNGVQTQRAKALLAVDNGSSRAKAAEQAGLTTGQVQYAVKKFHEQRLVAIPEAMDFIVIEAAESEDLGVGVAQETAVVDESPVAEIPISEETAVEEKTNARVRRLLAELEKLTEDLRASLPDAGSSPYSPVTMLALVRTNVSKYTPDIQLQILEQFEGMSREDLTDLETWKGISYMIAYSAQFQAIQTRDKLNEQLPDPFKPDSVVQLLREGLVRVTPEIARQLAANLEGATVEDLRDPDTWKGMGYMLGYSAQFQAIQTRDRLDEQMPGPLKPSTLWNLFKGGVDRVTPDVAKQILASFEGATREDLMDPDTWKGVWYMLNYSLQFQADQLKVRLLGEGSDEDQ